MSEITNVDRVTARLWQFFYRWHPRKRKQVEAVRERLIAANSLYNRVRVTIHPVTLDEMGRLVPVRRFGRWRRGDR